MQIFSGRISSTGFSSGDRFVIGDWLVSPLGKFTNIMWAKPDGTRVLLSPSREHADYVSRLYNFEEVIIVGIEVERSRKGISVVAGEVSINLEWGVSITIPFWRPLWFIRSIEYFFARIVFGTRTFGRTKDGRREWYSVRSVSRILMAQGEIDGSSLGSKVSFETGACFGFSDPPSMPTSVRLKSYIE